MAAPGLGLRSLGSFHAAASALAVVGEQPGAESPIDSKEPFMPSTPQITLDIRLGNAPDSTWHNTTASDGSPYCYQYTGGDDGAGGLVQTVGNGRDTAPLRSVADRRYQIVSCNFLNDPLNQLSWSGNGNYAGSIIDQNSQVETAEYSIEIQDTGNNNVLFPCDPPVTNKPPA